MSGNPELAAATINTARHLGVGDFVICAGARNVPLIADLCEREEITLWNHFDERSAAFFALGLARVKARPVAVVTTSGTAVAELFPAVIEAHYSGIPLVLITADRPASFRGSGAPQAIEQAGIFGKYVSQSLDWETDRMEAPEIIWDQQSPLHLNVCFGEPIVEVSGERLETLGVDGKISIPKKPKAPRLKPLQPLAIIGELQESERAEVQDFLQRTGIPAWFEATSGLREDAALEHLRIAQESEISPLKPGGIIRIGGVPSLRFWRDLETPSGLPVTNFSRNPFPGLARKENVETLALSDLTGYSPPFKRVQSPIKEGTIDRKLARHPASEPALVAALSELIPSAAAVFLGNSLPIREWNLAASFAVPHPHCFANRGANGIDGEVSTFLGISAGFDEAWGIFGDLTALYDLNAPWVIGQLPHGGKCRIVVLNNGGGRIFSRLPAMRRLSPAAMARTENHHQTHFSGWADLWGLAYVEWEDQPEKWSLPTDDAIIIEIKIDQEKSEAFWADQTA
ncbi:MAG: 2-succinyl-5-enolpyruvyl-6-hydroxy-3-cyclohexene-1-carboxylic-acid synthase [Verrucomicrobiales bacterium]